MGVDAWVWELGSPNPGPVKCDDATEGLGRESDELENCVWPGTVPDGLFLDDEGPGKGDVGEA